MLIKIARHFPNTGQWPLNLNQHRIVLFTKYISVLVQLLGTNLYAHRLLAPSLDCVTKLNYCLSKKVEFL